MYFVFTVCVPTWTEYRNSNVFDGQQVMSAKTVADCQKACLVNTQCTGVDFDNYQITCWMSGPWSGQRQLGTAIGVNHYDITRGSSCGKAVLVTTLKTVLFGKRPMKFYNFKVLPL